MGGRGRFEHEPRRGRAVIGVDVYIGCLLLFGLGFKFGLPMATARIDKSVAGAASASAPLFASTDSNRPPTDALTNTLPTTVKPAAANDDPPVLMAPVFEEKGSVDDLDPPKLPPILPKKETGAEPSKPIKLRPPQSIREDAPILFADAPKSRATEVKSATESDAKKNSGKGPLHPYFHRYLDQKEYFVRPGDTLELIAHRLYQDESKAADLLALNKDQLPTAEALKSGMTLKLP